MKRHIFSIFAAFVCGLALLSCSDNDYAELDKGRDELKLTANQATDVLDEQSHAAEALTLNWTTGNNFGTGSRIYYKLELAASGTNFASPYTAVDHETQVYTWSINQENLNSLLLDKLGGAVGKATSVDARVTAIVDGDESQVSTVTFTVTPYEAVTARLFLIGDATPNGWSADKATEMTRTDNGLFTWEGDLKAGSFKFITTQGQFLPSYNNDGTGKLVYRSSDSQPDEQFKITEDHFYKVTANLLTGELTVVQAEGVKPRFDELFFVGNPTGWSFEPMVKDALDGFLFRYGRVFENGQGGEFKFGTASGSWENMFKAPTANAAYTNQSVEFVSGFDPDNKWFLQDSETGKAYKICVDIRTGKERMMMREFTPYEMIYLVGDATPSGWDLGNATPMTATSSPYVFTWTGQLGAGELKFSCDKQSDWNGAWFMCSIGNDIEPTGQQERALFIDKSDNYLKDQYADINIGDVDNKWKIVSSGTYTITLNQLEETISIVKQ